MVCVCGWAGECTLYITRRMLVDALAWWNSLNKICSIHRERVHTLKSVQELLALSCLASICAPNGSRCNTQEVALPPQFQLVDLLHYLEAQFGQAAHLCCSVHISNNTCVAPELERKSHHPLACAMPSSSWKVLWKHCLIAFSFSCNAKPKCRPREIDWSSQCKQTAKQLLFDFMQTKFPHPRGNCPQEAPK